MNKQYAAIIKSAVLTALFTVATPGYAKPLGEIFRNIGEQFDSGAGMAQAFGQFAGVGLIIFGIIKLIQYNKSDGQQVKFSTCMYMIFGGAMLFFVVSMIDTAGDTVWGSGGGDTGRVRITR